MACSYCGKEGHNVRSHKQRKKTPTKKKTPKSQGRKSSSKKKPKCMGCGAAVTGEIEPGPLGWTKCKKCGLKFPTRRIRLRPRRNLRRNPYQPNPQSSLNDAERICPWCDQLILYQDKAWFDPRTDQFFCCRKCATAYNRAPTRRNPEGQMDPQLKRHLEAELRGAATGRRYRIDLNTLDNPSGRELLRLIRDLKDEASAAKRRARRHPRWGF